MKAQIAASLFCAPGGEGQARMRRRDLRWEEHDRKDEPKGSKLASVRSLKEDEQARKGGGRCARMCATGV